MMIHVIDLSTVFYFDNHLFQERILKYFNIEIKNVKTVSKTIIVYSPKCQSFPLFHLEVGFLDGVYCV